MCFTNIYAPKPKRYADLLAMQKIINWVELATGENFPSPVLPNNLLPPSHNQPTVWASENTDGPTTSGIQEDAWWLSPATLHHGIDIFDSTQPDGLLFTQTEEGLGQPLGGQPHTDPRQPSPTYAQMPLQSGASARQLAYFWETVGRTLQPVSLSDMHFLGDESDNELNIPAFPGSALASGGYTSTTVSPSESALTSEDPRARTLRALRDLDLNALTDHEAERLAVKLGKRRRQGEGDSDERPAKVQRLSLPFGRSDGQLLNVPMPTDENGTIPGSRKRDDMDMDVDMDVNEEEDEDEDDEDAVSVCSTSSEHGLVWCHSFPRDFE
ncbi:hypothetical protein CYLTODRAFT_426196 [Cylindrobasidium torrendii FP15055 ss-10]|uniref:Uncharacterized protein n=1 Tax=Cylindrobasidium torrendii FP15055 ss-10 TaxID=1314674 RepID=A0A0D7AY76_9AGAR|nr:hypothetical protein CYLTODRAFT_426196 [Cylindrobasidium torrendii FP15055 ss-10]